MAGVSLRRQWDTRARGPNARRRTELGLLLFGSLIVVATYTLVSIGTTSKVPQNLVPLLVVVLALALAAHLANRVYAPDANPVLLPVAALLNGLGYAMLARLDPHLARLQAGWTAFGIIAYLLTLAVVRHSRDLDRYRYVLLLAAIVLMLAPLMPHFGKNINGARLWVSIGPINGQPVELAKVLLVVFFASYFTEKRELLAIPTLRLGDRLVIDPRPLGPILLTWGFCMLILGAERDVGFAALIFVLFIAMLWLSTGRWNYVALGLGLFGVGAVVASRVFLQVHERVSIWLNPWPHAQSSGYQLVQGLYAFGLGGLTGTGLGFGYLGTAAHPVVPQLTTDFIFVAFGEETGLLGTTLIVFGFLLLVGAGLHIALRARSDFARLAAAGFTVILGMQAFFIMAGIVRLLPLTGITLPFIAYGGSSLIANYILIALLMRISDEGERAAVAAAAATATKVTDDGVGALEAR